MLSIDPVTMTLSAFYILVRSSVKVCGDVENERMFLYSITISTSLVKKSYSFEVIITWCQRKIKDKRDFAD